MSSTDLLFQTENEMEIGADDNSKTTHFMNK